MIAGSSTYCAVQDRRQTRARTLVRTLPAHALALVLLVLLALSSIGRPPSAFADEEHSRYASTSEMAAARELGEPGMVPIEAADLKEGSYDIDVESSSSFFKVVSAQLRVEGDAMEADIVLRSSSYTLVYMGTGQKAAAAAASSYIDFNAEEKSFTIPVPALDVSFDCAAYSKKRKKWYDRKLLLRADSLPEGALLVELPDYSSAASAEGEANSAAASARTDNSPAAAANTDKAGVAGAQTAGSADEQPEAAPLDLPDGEYSIEVNMTGGSGRASVSSPTWLIVEDGRAWARLLWSSSYYDYMIVDEYRYDNLTTDGSNSTFKIPITAFDDEIDVVADTTAMGDPVEIEYHLCFYSDTIGEKNLIPQEAAILVLELALAVIVVGGILNYWLKKRRKQ